MEKKYEYPLFTKEGITFPERQEIARRKLDLYKTLNKMKIEYWVEYEYHNPDTTLYIVFGHRDDFIRFHLIRGDFGF